MNDRRGFFLSIEGVEGSGKTSIAAELGRRLVDAGMEVVITAEPGGDEIGKRIREILLDSSEILSNRAEILLFAAGRAQHVDRIIAPALERGAVVICDRFADSSVAYQGYARGIDVEFINTLNDFAVQSIKPNLTILLDMPAEAGLARQKKVDRISAEKLSFHEAVRQGFLSVARKEPERFIVINASDPFDVVMERVYAAVIERMGRV